MATWSLVARLPTGMIGLALPLIAMSAELSPLVAGIALAAYRSAQAVATPVWGRLADRIALRYLLMGVPVLYGLVSVAIAAGSPPVMLVVASAALGAVTLPYSAIMRAFWNRQSDHAEYRKAANAFESAMAEGVLVSGRVGLMLAALICPLPVVVTGQAVLAIVGAVVLSRTARVRADHPVRSGGTDRTGTVPVSNLPAVLLVYLSFVLLSASLGAYSLTIVVVLEGRAHGASWAASAVTGWGLGSLVGVTWLARRFAGRTPRVTAMVSVVCMAVAQWMSIAPAVGGIALLLPAAFAAGVPIAIAVSALYEILGAVVPVERQSELFALATTTVFAGDSAGSAAAGFAADRIGWAGSGFVLSGGLAVLAVVAIGVTRMAIPWHLER